MAKYSYEFKLKVVKEYLAGRGGYTYIAQQNGISNKCVLQKWVKAHQEFGDEGIKRSGKNRSNTFEFKKSVVDKIIVFAKNTRILAIEGYMKSLENKVCKSTKRRFKD